MIEPRSSGQDGFWTVISSPIEVGHDSHKSAQILSDWHICVSRMARRRAGRPDACVLIEQAVEMQWRLDTARISRRPPVAAQQSHRQKRHVTSVRARSLANKINIYIKHLRARWSLVTICLRPWDTRLSRTQGCVERELESDST